MRYTPSSGRRRNGQYGGTLEQRRWSRANQSRGSSTVQAHPPLHRQEHHAAGNPTRFIGYVFGALFRQFISCLEQQADGVARGLHDWTDVSLLSSSVSLQSRSLSA